MNFGTASAIATPRMSRSSATSSDRMHGESATAHAFRAAGDVLDAPIGSGKPSAYVKLRAGIFNYAGMVADKVITKGVWSLAAGQIARGVEYYQDHPEDFANSGHKLTSDVLGLKGADKDSFNRLTNQMQRYGANYNDAVRDAITNPNKVGFSEFLRPPRAFTRWPRDRDCAGRKSLWSPQRVLEQRDYPVCRTAPALVVCAGGAGWPDRPE